MRFSPSTLGWYPEYIEYQDAPDDLVEVSDELYESLLCKPLDVDANGLPCEKTEKPLTVEECRNALKASVTAKRYDIETGGIQLPNGTRLDTTREDQNAVANAIALADIAGVTSVDFKAANGWLSITIPQLKQIGAAIGLHKQSCYSAERAHHEAIDALPDPGLDAYDIEVGWPTGEDLASLFSPAAA